MALVHVGFVSAILVLGFLKEVYGAVWEVHGVDPPECGRIQIVVSQTAPGDTVRVGPGRYLENLLLPHSCTIMGSGESVTILEPCAGTGTVVRAEQVTKVVLKDLAFVNGTGSLITGLPYLLGGGALFKECAEAEIDGCRFDDNSADRGGGVWQLGGNFQAVRTSFHNNRGAKSVGACSLSGLANATLRDCEIWWDRDDAAYYGAILVDFAQQFEMTECTICADVSNEFDDVIIGVEVNAYEVSIDGCTFWDRGTTANATVADLFPFDVEEFPADVSVTRTVIGASQRLPEGSLTLGCFRGVTNAERLTLVNRNLILLGYGTEAIFRNCIAQDATVTLTGPDGSDGSCNVFWDADVDNRDFDLTGTRTIDPLLCDIPAQNVNVEDVSPCRPEHSEGCDWIGARDGMCIVTPVLVSGMEAVPSDRGVMVAWSFDGIEAQTEWSVWRLFGDNEHLVGGGQVSRTGMHSVEDAGSLPRGSVIYQLRVRELGSHWRTASSVAIVLSIPDGLIVGSSVVSNAVSLRLSQDAICRVIDSSGRVRATIAGQNDGLTTWTLRDEQGEQLESGVYWATTEVRADRFVIVR
jgi:hypothetical protein